MSDALELAYHGEPRRPAALRLLPDERLARRAARGDRAAFAVIVERHHQALYRYCRALLRHEEDARDALQNTLTRAMQALEGEEREIALRPWLHRIAHNEAISLVRRRRPHRELEPELAGTTPGADAQAIAGERMRDLLADLEELPDRQRSALVLRELNDLSYADIGAALETSEQAARQSVYEARVMLAELQEGRALPCEEIRTRLSARDGRLLRPRRVRAHLRSCAGCRDFRDAIGTRRSDLGALAPPLAPAASAALLNGLLGGGGSGGGLLAALGLGHGAGTAAATKGLVAIAAAAAVGGGAAVMDANVLPHPQHDPIPAAPATRPAPTTAVSGIVPRPDHRPVTPARGPRLAAPRHRASSEGPSRPRHAPASAAPRVHPAPAAVPVPTPAPTPTPRQAPSAEAETPASAGRDPGSPAQHPSAAGGNPTPGTPPAHSNAGGNGKGQAKGLANAPASSAEPPASEGAAPVSRGGATLPPTASPNAATGASTPNGKANGHAVAGDGA